MEKLNDLISRSALLEEYEWLKSQVAPCSVPEVEEHMGRIRNAPAVEAVEIPDAKLLRAVKLLLKQYEHSKNSEYVHSPVAHAFFHTWKQLDERRE